MEKEQRQHADLFTPEEAAAYLHLSSVETLATLKSKGWLQSYLAGKSVLYYRADLDDCALSIVGIHPPARHQAMRLAK